MGNRINVAELLKDCPKGMELDCVLFEKPAQYMEVSKSGTYIITIKTSCGKVFYLTKEGYLYDMADSQCIIFPKGKTTWEGFVPPCKFKDGDVVATTDGEWIGITTGGEQGRLIPTYCVIKSNGVFEAYLDIKDKWQFGRLATEEEKQKLFDAIKANGYKWNEETKTLGKLPRFKVGDIVKSKNCPTAGSFVIVGVGEDSYSINIKGYCIKFDDQDNYELVPNKFDISTLKPFESRVLVRDYNNDRWKVSFWGYLIDSEYSFKHDTVRGCYRQCIPYKGNEHLLGTTDDCIDFYKTW
jgi:hypothetical protein